MRLPLRRAHQLETRGDDHRWLIESLWSDQAVGIVGGAPKSCKSFCALDMAVSVASGAPCLGRFRPLQTGRVLLFAAEDPLGLVRERLDGIARASGHALERLEIFVITVPKLRLDVEDDRVKLLETVEKVKPKLLVLDPFVRLHSGDENNVAEVAPVLDYLRNLQRRLGCCVLLVHHARKHTGGLRGGQALRGSSELFAWTDSSLLLRRKDDELRLAVEHRAAPSLDDLRVELRSEGDGLALRVVVASTQACSPKLTPILAERVLQLLCQSDQPVTPRDLRQACHVRTATLYQALSELVASGTIVRDAAGYRPAQAAASSAATASAALQSNTGSGSGNAQSSAQPKDIR